MQLEIPVPPVFEDALGIADTPELLLGLFWGGDRLLRFTDGRLIGLCHADAFALYAYHPVARPVLDHYQLGPNDQATKHWLVLYRRVRKFDIVRAEEAEPYLRSSYPSWVPYQVIDQLPDTSKQQEAGRQMVAWLDTIKQR